jgi:NADPH:quinone reductase-like Zn-dependent oxidoreductase
MVRAFEEWGFKPVIDSSYSLAQLADAFRHQESQQHFGKIVLDLS